MTKKLTKEEKEKRQFISFGSRQKTLTEIVNSDRNFLKNLIRPDFRGLQIFGHYAAYNDWMDRWADRLESIRGTYNTATKRWTFAHGATLDLQIMQKTESGKKLAGMNFNYVEVEGAIDPEMQKAVMEKMYARLKEKL